MAQIDGVQKTYAAFQMRSFRENLSIPDKIWAELEPAYKEEIMKIRSRVKARDRPGSQGSQAPSQAPTQGKVPTVPSAAPGKLPSQYPTMTNRQAIANLVSSLVDLAVDEDEDSESMDDDMLQITSAFMVRSGIPCDHPMDPILPDIEVRAHLEYSMHSSKTFAFTDGGADSCILGKYAK